ncbi:MAG: imidazole glycerol phosphate synthase subunit HisH [Phycisphaerae bacterium]
MNNARIAIIDYGMGNLRSVQKALQYCGGTADIIDRPEQVRTADKIILPGVGAFGDAVAILKRTGLDQAIRDYARSGKILLGICLGMQLLVDVGEEDGPFPGLGLLPGRAVRFDVDQPPLNLKVPHMGWNELNFTPGSKLGHGLPVGSYAYFVHGYYVAPTDAAVVSCWCDYGRPFAAGIEHQNIMATQFHPEKSQAVGQAILRNFIAL